MEKVRVRNTACRGARPIHTLTKLELFVKSLEEAFGLALPLPSFSEVGHIKEFCSGLLEGKSHPWRSRLERLSSRSRMSIAFSLFLFRKVIPSERPSVLPYLEKMGTPMEVKPDDDFLKFCEREVHRLFRPGWDKKYRRCVESSSLPLSSCSEQGRRQGGCRGLDVEKRWSRDDFCKYVLDAVVPMKRTVSRVVPVESGGKWRIISIPPRVDNALRPLHLSMYDHMSHFKWLLRGDAKASRFGSFTKTGEVFVSGDYESATDNLSSEVQLTILKAVLDGASTVPFGIKQHAVSTYTSLLSGEGREVQQSRGQLMGQLTSFPLLCLVNYLVFKYHVPRNVPVLVNGDDIVFRASPSEAERWMQGVGKCGLTLSVGKTLVHKRYFSLNSTCFDAGLRNVRFVPFVRPKSIWSTKETAAERVASLEGRFYSLTKGFGKDRASTFQSLFCSQNAYEINLSRRSVTRGLGLSVKEGTLRRCKLWARELFYLKNDSEPPLPYNMELMRVGLPDGYKQVSRHSVSDFDREIGQALFNAEMIDRAWTKPVVRQNVEGEWLAKLHQGVSPWDLCTLVKPKMLNLLKLTRRQAREWLFAGDSSLFGRQRFTRGKGVWVVDVSFYETPEVHVQCQVRAAIQVRDVSIRITCGPKREYLFFAPPKAL